ncbi:MAG: DUF1697 domain-containing protein [Candidatus Bathyarchaeia archaeon]|jgi:uncharacterized protein (DUF1697 family)
MYRFVAFLRGINVGGHTVTKQTLQTAFESLGFAHVSTFKQSGNIVFESQTADPEAIRTQIHDQLRQVLGYEVLVFLRTFAQLQEIVASDPFRGQEAEGSSFPVTFLGCKLPVFPLQLPLTIPKSTAQVILARETEVFSVTHGGGEGALPNTFLESKLKVKATTRNFNVIRAIVEKNG